MFPSVCLKAAIMQVGSIIFLAEWGDRSMLATVALGASHSPLGEQSSLGCPYSSIHSMSDGSIDVHWQVCMLQSQS